MPRMQVYLPDDLYRAVKAGQLPASELLQAAVRAEVRRRQLQEEARTYLDELVAEVGEPSPEETSEAEALAERVRQAQDRLAQNRQAQDRQAQDRQARDAQAM